MTLQAIKYESGKLFILDQLKLPGDTVYLDVPDVQTAWTAIHTMQVRGAPAIAIVGCLSLAVELHSKIPSNINKNELHCVVKEKLTYLTTSRPTAVNLTKEVDKLIELSSKLSLSDRSNLDMRNELLKAIEDLLRKDVEDNKAIGVYGAEEILRGREDRVRVLTHCNTGSLATAGYGTALGVIRRLHELNRIERVYCTETRPYMQGSRLTAYELVYEKIPSTLICDSMIAALFQSTRIHGVVVGADRVAANGDTANKIGTYQIAVLCKYHNVDFYVCAPLSSIDFGIESGRQILIEERAEKEMTDICGMKIAASGIKCWNPAFDVTPASLIKAIITEKGAFPPNQIGELNILK